MKQAFVLFTVFIITVLAEYQKYIYPCYNGNIERYYNCLLSVLEKFLRLNHAHFLKFFMYKAFFKSLDYNSESLDFSLRNILSLSLRDFRHYY